MLCCKRFAAWNQFAYSHFVPAIKTDGKRNVKYNLWYVIGRHRDYLNYCLFQSAQTIQKSSVCFLISVELCFKLKIWQSDVKLTLLQSTKTFKRRVFIKNTAPKLYLRENQCLEQIKPLHGLSDAVELRNNTLKKHFTEDIGLIAAKTDPSFSLCFIQGKLVGMNRSVVDDLIQAGARGF